jgi:hypothetical protein
MLVPIAVKNIAITMMIAAQPMIWIVTTARFASFAPITCLFSGKHFVDHASTSVDGLIDWGAVVLNDPQSTDVSK